MELASVIILLIGHFVGNFLCQTPEMVVKKSREILWLSIHSGMYTLMMSMGWIIIWLIFIYYKPEIFNFWKFVVLPIPLTYGAHWIINYFSSRLIVRFEKAREHTNSYIIFGLEQTLCVISIITIYKLTMGFNG